jgi:long-chain acyl-CoA synthetase
VTNKKVAESLLSAPAAVPRVNTLIVVEDTYDRFTATSDKISIVPFTILLSDGRNMNNNSSSGVTDVHAAVHQIGEDDIALIMYTSGTSGIPKGVMYSQKVLREALKLGWSLFSDRIPMQPFSDPTDKCHLAYLPLAHIFEFTMQHLFLTTGGHIGYGSPFTAFTNGIGLMDETLSDCESLNPTSTAAVPLVLERMKSSILQQIQKKPAVLQRLFRFGVNYKYFWNRHGFSTPITDKVLFSKTSQIFGRRLKCLCLGGAAVSQDTHRFMRSVLNTCISQGLGATETFATASAQDRYSYDSSIGYPWPGIKFQLRDWDEGGYKVTDKPHARGELLIGGKHIALGYFQKPDETAESFKSDPRDPDYRWFMTGDIVEVDECGSFKIVDRKADLIKLMNGEFMALGRIEALLKTCNLIENVFVYGNSLSAFLVAIIVPNAGQLLNLAKQADPSLAASKLPELCANPVITSKVMDAIRVAAKAVKLKDIEIPKRILLVDDEWTPDNGLITASLKTRRKQLQLKYSEVLDKLLRQ